MFRLFCGSRSLSSRAGKNLPQAEEWGYGIIRSVLTPDDIVITGYADGPDKWSIQEAHTMGIPWYSYQPSGFIVTADGPGREWAKGRGTKPASGDNHGVWKRWFLLRDEVMVAHMARFRDLGHAVEVHGLLDPGSATQGTQFTLRHAEKAGLPVFRYEFQG